MSRIGIEIRGLYDGVVIWVEPDGTLTNRFADTPGWEALAAKVDKIIEEEGDEYRDLARRYEQIEDAEITERGEEESD